jgi:hypothetical protein
LLTNLKRKKMVQEEVDSAAVAAVVVTAVAVETVAVAVAATVVVAAAVTVVAEAAAVAAEVSAEAETVVAAEVIVNQHIVYIKRSRLQRDLFCFY